jgi:heme/copper-type cytochrome/quinol oxidase subunit 2
LVQKVTTPIIILVIFILVLVIATKVILKYRMKKNAITDEKGINQQQYNQTFTQFNKNEVTPEEYENIWEKGNL